MRMRKLISLLLALCLLLSPVMVLADEVTTEATAETVQTEASAETVEIASTEDFLTFVENCRLDSYSVGKTFTLTCDLNLIGMGEVTIPTFSGTLEGNGYTISGVAITASGSVAGLIRYVTKSGVIRNLTVAGTVQPGGSANHVGGIAGENQGLIENCAFSGTVSGNDRIGGIAGYNKLSGIIDGCSTSGIVYGNHDIGGTAGENAGVIRNCENEASINNQVRHNSVELSDVTLDNLLGTELAVSVTDIGGIAGTSTGVIRDCKNFGNVGYPHMGYNIGGIVGCQSGYVTGCENSGHVQGRKEVGGIAGQQEPALLITFDTDTIQILKGQLGTLGTLANETASVAQSGLSNLETQAESVRNQINTAKDAAESLIPSEENPNLPEWDSIQAAQNSISSNLVGANGDLKNMISTTTGTISSLSDSLEALMKQLNVISGTMNNATEYLGGTLADASDGDTEDLLTSKISDCSNSGAVSGDWNCGGIVGAITLDNGTDPEENVDLSGSYSLNVEGELRSVILSCSNSGAVSARKQHCGGIVGWMSMGLVKASRNTGAVAAAGGSYAGGIAGRGTGGYIRQCGAKCTVTGKTYVGGIAGSAKTVSDCYSLTKITATEKQGNILGYEKDLTGIQKNYYLSWGSDVGAIDGVSYDQCAQGLKLDAFLALEQLPELFQSVKVRFVMPDGEEKTLSLTPGSSLKDSEIPALPEVSGESWSWENLNDTTRAEILFDVTFRAVCSKGCVTIESDRQSETGLPLLLAQGTFTDAFPLTMEAGESGPEAGEGDVIALWRYTLPEDGKAEKLRCLIEGEYDGLQVFVCRNGQWRQEESKLEGSYLVFPVVTEDEAFCVIATTENSNWVYWLVAAAVAAAGACVLFLLRKKKKR